MAEEWALYGCGRFNVLHLLGQKIDSGVMMYQKVFEFFSRIILNDPQAISLVSQYNDKLEWSEGQLIFTIDGLYRLLIDEKEFSYPEFRSMLYASDLNQALQTLGFKVIIFESTHKVDTSIYQLVRIIR